MVPEDVLAVLADPDQDSDVNSAWSSLTARGA